MSLYLRKEGIFKKTPKTEEQQGPTRTSRIAYPQYIAGGTKRLKRALEKRNNTIRFNTVPKIEQLLPPNKDTLLKLLTIDMYEMLMREELYRLGVTDYIM